MSEETTSRKKKTGKLTDEELEEVSGGMEDMLRTGDGPGGPLKYKLPENATDKLNPKD